MIWGRDGSHSTEAVKPDDAAALDLLDCGSGVKSKLVQLGLEPVGSTPVDFASFVQAEIIKSADVVKARGIKAD